MLGADEDLMETDFTANKLSFTSKIEVDAEMEVKARIRYKAKEEPALVILRDGYADIRFVEPQRAITPGQPVVFYQDEEMIGGGIIEDLVVNAPIDSNSETIAVF